MRVSTPYFDEGVNYRRLSAAERKGKGWLFVTLADTEVRFAEPIAAGLYHLMDGRDFEWGTITPTSIRVRKGYAWNGSSCALDFPSNLLASLVHDLLYQFSGCLGFPVRITRGWADSMFYAICAKQGFRLRPLYRLGLWLGSWAAWSRTPVDGEHIESTH